MVIVFKLTAFRLDNFTALLPFTWWTCSRHWRRSISQRSRTLLCYSLPDDSRSRHVGFAITFPSLELSGNLRNSCTVSIRSTIVPGTWRGTCLGHFEIRSAKRIESLICGCCTMLSELNTTKLDACSNLMRCGLRHRRKRYRDGRSQVRCSFRAPSQRALFSSTANEVYHRKGCKNQW